MCWKKQVNITGNLDRMNYQIQITDYTYLRHNNYPFWSTDFRASTPTVLKFQAPTFGKSSLKSTRCQKTGYADLLEFEENELNNTQEVQPQFRGTWFERNHMENFVQTKIFSRQQIICSMKRNFALFHFLYILHKFDPHSKTWAF